MNNNPRFIYEKIKDEYKNWENGDLIFINSGTGTGKTHFIKTILLNYCKENNLKILYLTNRDNLKDQLISDLVDTNFIKIINYQEIENKLDRDKYLNQYDYVVADECHYFFTDASFNSKTDLYFNELLKNKNICKIFMTATQYTSLLYFSTTNYITKIYELKTNYDYIEKIYSFKNTETIEDIINNVPINEQIIFFSRSADIALNMAKKFNGAFICSKHNNQYSKYIDYIELENIIKRSEFKNRLLCTTTTLDNGINIKEGSGVKHIIIDIFDRDTFIQCLGRRRIGNGETIILYIKDFNKQKINGFKKRISDTLDSADYLKEHGQEEYVKKAYKNINFINSKIIDDILDKENHIQKVINKCMYHKYKYDLLVCNSILNNDATFKSIICLSLNKEVKTIIDIEERNEKISLELYLESNITNKLYKYNQKELIELIGLKDSRGRIQKNIELLNEYLKQNSDFILVKGIDKRRKLENGEMNTNRDKTFWQIIKTNLQ